MSVCDCGRSWPRRRFLASAAGLAGVTAAAGCLGDGEGADVSTDPEPIADGQQCDVCGMVVAGGYGPNGQVFYDGDYPPDRAGPAWYDSVRELFVDRFGRPEDALATFVTDFATAEYEVVTRNGDQYVTGTVAPETLVSADDAAFVVDSDVLGAMGPDLLPFGSPGAAESFVETYGGRIVEADAVTPDLVDSL